MTMHMGHVALRVPDVERAASHAERTMGLRRTLDTPDEIHLSANEKHHELQLLRGAPAGLDHVGLEVETRERLTEIRGRIRASSARLLEVVPAEAGRGDAMRFVGPAGIVYELYTHMDREPLTVATRLGPRTRKFGHLTFYCEDHDEVVAFWVGVLGFRISDTAEGLTWTRCDSDHHGLAVAHVPGANRLHHHAWEVQDLSALCRYCDHIATDGHVLLWGPVRHGPGFNIATYLRDPDGIVTEVYTDLLRIPDDLAYVPVDWSREPRALNLWGPGPSEELLAAGLPILTPPPG
jgi:catechol-2,3-dioxygenase